MAYIDVWKKKMQGYGIHESDSRLNSSKAFIRRHFKYDPTYRSATIQKLDMTREPIDIRWEIVANTTTENRIIFLPDTVVEVGSYIEYDNEIWIIREFQHKGLSPYGVASICNQTLNWEGLEKPIPCYTEDSAYNDKGEINLDMFSMVDGKVACYVPVNEITNKIEQNMRFTFNSHKMMVFEVISIKNVTTPTIYKIIMKKVEYFEGKDDLENNIAYNEDFISDNIDNKNDNNVNTISSNIKNGILKQYNAGTLSMKINGEDSKENWNISIDYGTVDKNSVKVENITNSSIKIRNINATQGTINVKFEKGGEVINESVVMSR